MTLLSLRNVEAGYGASQVLFGVDLVIRAGEVATLLGRNGMGKTTTLRTLFGLVPLKGGAIHFDGQRIDGLRTDAIARLGIALVPEGRQIFPNLTVRENLDAFAENRGGTAATWNAGRVLDLFPRLRQRLRAMGNELSGGEQQMLAIGRALMTNPRLLILDEATEGLAPLVRDDIWRCLADLRNSGQTILVIDKYVDRLVRLADHHTILERGRVAWRGTSDALGADPALVTLELGDSALPFAMLAGGSMGTTSWGSAVVKACALLSERLGELGGEVPAAGFEVSVDTAEDVAADEHLERHAFGAQFAEVRVDADTGEVRVPRLLGVFAAGRILNPLTARSQLIGGMTMGLSMALHEESVLDREFGDYLNHDFAQYHVAACADVAQLEATWLEEDDPHLNPMGAKGIGEIGIVGTAAAIANAVHHATAIRIRDLPLRLDRLLEAGLSAAG
jgi:ABC-type branched-subunit amino acid transport system ATPase component